MLSLLVLAWFWDYFTWDGMVILFYGVMLFLFRKKEVNPWDNPVNIEHSFFSPVNGRIKALEENATAPQYTGKWKSIVIKTRPTQEMGIFMPLNAEVKDMVAHPGKRLWRILGPMAGKKDECEYFRLTLHSWDGEDILLDFYPFFFGARPQIVLLPGDKGRKLVNIGHFPFGGQVVVYLPEKYEIIVQEDEAAIAGETLLAGDIEGRHE
jgi:hypothetical protein